MHVGGEERRGDLSDAFIRAVVPYGQHVIIVESGNKTDSSISCSRAERAPGPGNEDLRNAGANESGTGAVAPPGSTGRCALRGASPHPPGYGGGRRC